MGNQTSGVQRFHGYPPLVASSPNIAPGRIPSRHEDSVASLAPGALEKVRVGHSAGEGATDEGSLP
jgi:hypothetical protein